MTKRIKLGMIGGGPGSFIGPVHRKGARMTNDYEFVGGVFSSDYEKSKQVAEIDHIDVNRIYPDLDTLIKTELALPAEERMQAVSIVTPNCFHFEAAQKLLSSGFHVICDKPVTTTVDEAKALMNLVKETGLTFCLTHTYLGYPMVRQMRELVKSGVLGEIQRVDAQYYQGWVNPLIHGGDSHLSAWRFDAKYAGASSCLGDIGVHAFNLIEYSTGLKCTQLLADMNNVVGHVELDLDATVMLRMDNNCLGLVRACQVAAGEENDLRIGIYGSKASLKWEQENPNYLYLISDDEPNKVYRPAHSYNSEIAAMSSGLPCGHPEGLHEAFANLYAAAAKSIRGEELKDGELPGIEDGVRGMMFIEGSVESYKKGNTWVKM